MNRYLIIFNNNEEHEIIEAKDFYTCIKYFAECCGTWSRVLELALHGLDNPKDIVDVYNGYCNYDIISEIYVLNNQIYGIKKESFY